MPKKAGKLVVPVTVNLEVHWETDDNGENPKPIVNSNTPSMAFGGSLWRISSAILSDEKILQTVNAAIEAACATKASAQ